MAISYISITKTLFVKHSREVKVFESRIFGTIVRNANKLVRAFLFVSNHSTWSMGFSAALARVQALYSNNVGALYRHTCAASYTYYSWNICGKFKNRRRCKSFCFQRRALGRAEINCFLPKSDKFSHQVPPCNNCDIKNVGKRVKKFGQHWLLLTVQYLVCILTVVIFACVSGQRTSCLSLSLFFHCSTMKIR